MRWLYEIRPTYHFFFFILLPETGAIILGLATYYFSVNYIYVLVGLLYLHILCIQVRRYFLGSNLYLIAGYENKRNNKLKIFSFSIIYMIYALSIATFLFIIAIIEKPAVEITIFRIVLAGSILPAYFVQFYIPRFLTEMLLEVESKALGIESDKEKTRIYFSYPAFYNWKLIPRINRVFEMTKTNNAER